MVERECLFPGNHDVGHAVEIAFAGETRTPAGRRLEARMRCPVHGRQLAAMRITLSG